MSSTTARFSASPRLSFSLLLSLTALVACEDRLPEDKDDGSDGATDGATDGTTDGGSGDGTTDGGTDGGADGTADGGGGDGGGTTDCQAALDVGLWMDTEYMDASLLTTTPYTNDAGIAAVKAALPEGEEPVAVSLPISGAIVTSVGYAPSGAGPDIWLSDASGAVFTFRAGDETLGVKPGDAVSFTVTELTNYFDKLEITGLSDFSIDSSGNPIFYNVGYDTAIDVDAWAFQNVLVWGELVTEPVSCGGSYSCFDLRSGSQTVAYRINLESLGDYPDRNGDCVQALAPLDIFSGAAQINIFNYDWRYVVF